MFFFKKKQPSKPELSYDPETQKPIIRCSICTGEQVAGIKNLKTGKFEEYMLIRNQSDLQHFQDMVGCSDIPKEY